MMIIRFLVAAVVSVLIILGYSTYAANAEMRWKPISAVCAPYEEMASALGDDHGEVITHQGIAGPNSTRLGQLWVNANTLAWTFVVVAPDKTACAVVSGQMWDRAPPPVLNKDDTS